MTCKMALRVALVTAVHVVILGCGDSRGDPSLVVQLASRETQPADQALGRDVVVFARDGACLRIATINGVYSLPTDLLAAIDGDGSSVVAVGDEPALLYSRVICAEGIVECSFSADLFDLADGVEASVANCKSDSVGRVFLLNRTISVTRISTQLPAESPAGEVSAD